MEPKKIEIIDYSGENFNLLSFSCSTFFIIIVILAIVNGIIAFFFPQLFIGISLGSFILIIFILICYYIFKSPSKIRMFSISDKEIEFFFPKISYFRISWPEFKKIEIILKKFDIKPFHIYEINFIGKDSQKNFSFSLSDFQREKIEKILFYLKEYARKMRKNFRAVKEIEVSGVIIVEDLEV